MRESTKSNSCYAVGDSNRGEGGAILESIISNARYWTIKDNNALTIIVSITYNICAKASSVAWCYDIAIGGGVGDLPCWVNDMPLCIQ